jgi:hypothetical protein
MVKANWDTEELIENWTLLPTELDLVKNKVGGNQIAFAFLLKHFQIFACFPENNLSIPKVIISYIASQINTPENCYSNFDFKGRSAKVYRVEIRRLFNFRVATVQDSAQMSDWLIEKILPNEQRIEPISELVYQRWRELQIEPPTQGRVERLIKSAIASHETDFCSSTLDKLTPEIIEQIDILLSTDDTEEPENAESVEQSGRKIKMSDFAFLKTDPGAVGLESFLTELSKLKRIRATGLPTNFMIGKSSKLVKTYRQLYRPYAGVANAYPNLEPVMTRPINWDLIRQQYDQMVKYATALRLGTAETEAILKRFSKNPFKHPTYLALMELGRVIKTIFLCQYLDSETVRREINEGLNVVERWNGVNDFIFYGKGGEFADNRLESQELSVLSLHLLQICLVYVNTLMIQSVLAQRHWEKRLTATDLRAITPLIFGHVNPYGLFKLDMNERISRLAQPLVA